MTTEVDFFGRDGSVLRLDDAPLGSRDALDVLDAATQLGELERDHLVALWLEHGWCVGDPPATDELRHWCTDLLDRGWRIRALAPATHATALRSQREPAPWLHELGPSVLPATREVILHLFDRRGRRLYGAAFEVEYDGGHASGVSDDGAVVITVPANTRQVVLRWGRPDGERPAGVPALEFSSRIYVDVEASGNAVEALRRKLHNLGRGHRRLDVAVASFQASTGAVITGRREDAASVVEQRHRAADPLRPEDRGA